MIFRKTQGIADMRKLGHSVLLIFVLSAIAADAPFAGKWKLNPSRSQFAGEATIERLPSGEYRHEEQGIDFKFRLDGNDYPLPNGDTVSWREIGRDVWESTQRKQGRIVAVFRLTARGDVLSSTATIPQVDGKDLVQTAEARRISGGPGIVGRWQWTTVSAPATMMELEVDGAEGITIRYPGFGSECIAKFDGRPYPTTRKDSNTSMAFRKTGPASFEATTFLDGKPWYIDSFTVSPDGKVLTDEGTPASRKEPIKQIYERQ
jgi:hypothetical protein